MKFAEYIRLLSDSRRRWCPPIRMTRLCQAFLLSCTTFSLLSASESIPDEALDCLIEPWVVSDVGSQEQGVIAKLLVDRGESVTKGQPLAQLESDVEISEVALAKLRAETQSEVLAREAELRLAALELARLEDLNQEELITAQQRDESTARYQIASASLTQALENQKIQQLELKRMQHQYARRILTSPLDGVVVAQSAFAGEFVYDNPVMTIASLDPLRVEVMLPARLFGSISVGDTAHLYPELNKDSTLLATVDVVDAMLDSRSGTFGIRLKLSNPDLTIPAGQRCRITFGPSPAAAQPDDSASLDAVDNEPDEPATIAESEDR
jgi:RND family efflux transporter MFP subunit